MYLILNTKLPQTFRKTGGQICTSMCLCSPGERVRFNTQEIDDSILDEIKNSDEHGSVQPAGLAGKGHTGMGEGHQIVTRDQPVPVGQVKGIQRRLDSEGCI
jgi:hypothetical protein